MLGEGQRGDCQNITIKLLRRILTDAPDTVPGAVPRRDQRGAAAGQWLCMSWQSQALPVTG